MDATLHAEPIHYLLAYAGMTIHVLLRIAELRKEDKFSVVKYVKKNIFSLIASVITIPVLIIMATDPAVRETLPLNYITAVLAGWQTDSTFKSLMGMYSKKKPTKPEN